MPSAKQIKARKAFARKYAKKGKRKAKSKKPKKDTLKTFKGRKKKFFESVGMPELASDPNWDAKWDKKMQEFLNKSNNES